MLRKTHSQHFKKVGMTDIRQFTDWYRSYPARTDEQWRDMYHCFYPYLFNHGDKFSLYPKINENPRTWQPHQLQTVYDAVREDRYDAFIRVREKFPELYQDTQHWDKPPPFGEFNQFYSVRCGMIGIRVKYVREFDAMGNALLLSMLWVPDNQIIEHKTKEKHGYDAMVVGAMNVSPEFHSPRIARRFKEAGVAVKHVVKEFRCTPDAFLPVGTKLDVRHFKVGQETQLSMMTFDRGFQGVVKRFGFDGSRAWTGDSKWHRRVGSIGAQGQHRTYPGKALPGWMGGDKRFFYQKPIYRIDYKNSLVYVVSRLPCDVGAYVTLEDGDYRMGSTQWSMNRGYPPFPTFVGTPQDAMELSSKTTEECQLVSPPLLGYMKDESIEFSQVSQTDIDDARQVKPVIAPPKQEIYDYKKYRDDQKRKQKENKAKRAKFITMLDPIIQAKREETRRRKQAEYSRQKVMK